MINAKCAIFGPEGSNGLKDESSGLGQVSHTSLGHRLQYRATSSIASMYQFYGFNGTLAAAPPSARRNLDINPCFVCCSETQQKEGDTGNWAETFRPRCTSEPHQGEKDLGPHC